MKLKIAAIAVFVFLVSTSFSIRPSEKMCLSTEEQQLYNLLNEYRKTNNLPPIALSGALTKVAQTHVLDLANKQPHNQKCNLHSWSKSTNWDGCCYTDDHKQAACMWAKPKEIAGYTGDGFEIAADLGDVATAQKALKGWKTSKGHNQVMINQGTWAKISWKAVGIGIYENYAVIWFGAVPDVTGIEVENCP